MISRSFARDEDFLGLQVPMDDLLFMGGGETARNAGAVLEHLPEGKGAARS
jgi:hypothetical protein